MTIPAISVIDRAMVADGLGLILSGAPAGSLRLAGAIIPQTKKTMEENIISPCNSFRSGVLVKLFSHYLASKNADALRPSCGGNAKLSLSIICSYLFLSYMVYSLVTFLRSLLSGVIIPCFDAFAMRWQCRCNAFASSPVIMTNRKSSGAVKGKGGTMGGMRINNGYINYYQGVSL